MAQRPYKVTKRMQKSVMLMVASGMSEREIAAAMDIARDTLRYHYEHELEVGRGIVRRELLNLAMKQAHKGSVSAIRLLLAEGAASGLPKQYIGKKEHQAEAAKVAGVGTEWEADLRRMMPQADDKPN